MKKVLCFAAAAMAIFASCQKTEVVYSNDGPQEIALFAVNKTATKAPVSSAAFPEDYDMWVAAYLTAGSADNQKHDYFGRTRFGFSESDNTWKGGMYWPLSASTLNFLAVTCPQADDNAYTGSVSDVNFGTINYASSVTLDFSDNQTVQANGNAAGKYNQFDLMYAAGQQSNTIGTTGTSSYQTAGLIFAHALSWINFTVAKNNVTPNVVVNSIRLNGASYGGTLMLNNANYNNASTSSTENVTPQWTSVVNPISNVYVPGGSADKDEDTNAFADKNISATGNAAAVTLNTDAQAFGNGLLVIPNKYTTSPSFTINYTITQDGIANTFEYTYDFGANTEWDFAKKYTYNVVIKLTEIEVTPSVTSWTAVSGTDVYLGI